MLTTEEIGRAFMAKAAEVPVKAPKLIQIPEPLERIEHGNITSPKVVGNASSIAGAQSARVARPVPDLEQ